MRRIDRKKIAATVFTRLQARYPSPQPALVHKSPWELLVATVLAAQCTDIRVNTVTPKFFRLWPGPAELARADVAEIETVIHSMGFFRNKAKNILAAARRVVDSFQGQVPRTMAELITLPGVARKTANIVLFNAFGLNKGIAVDTHVSRLAFRLGLTESDNHVVIEKDLMPLFPRQGWGDINHYLVLLGREICKASTPRCTECPLANVCPRKGVLP